MSETKPSVPAVRPPEPKTVRDLEIPPPWAIALSEKVIDGFAGVDARLDGVESNVSILVDDKKTMNERLSRIESWRDSEVTARLNANSERVRGESHTNLKQDAVISQVVTRLDAVEANQTKAADERASTAEDVKAIKNAVVGVVTNKKVILVGKALFTLAAAYLAAKGIKVIP